ncbi:hypothetical protein DICVIV_10311 [Dictyocaulus viviparus]|uniref:RRM domain-containing protein n=1 Tax=Dictyocaulus viviparus TaxID=29172 RepID=A0A0D8XIT5_DICVI|nr:hypothetical protein DICVIV_10311 [Dictyocaulus viviparus]
MNPLTNIKNQNKLNERELKLGIAGDLRKSWHQKYKDSAWIYIGGLPYDLTEGDIITVFSQFGEVININLLRHADTGKSRGFCFLCYEDQRSTVLAVDNLNGITLLKRVIRVDHVEQYKVPKYREGADEETKRLWEEGCAPKPIRRIDKNISQSKLEDENDAKNKVVSLKKLMKKTAGNVDMDWKEQSKFLDKSVKEENFYGPNKHFSFGKKNDVIEEPTHNPRPDFEKADWRDIEIWKEIREREKAEQGGSKKCDWKQEEHYISSRYR